MRMQIVWRQPKITIDDDNNGDDYAVIMTKSVNDAGVAAKENYVLESQW